jgi:hypothetical protein
VYLQLIELRQVHLPRFANILTSMGKLRQKSRQKSSSGSIEEFYNILKLLTYHEKDELGPVLAV